MLQATHEIGGRVTILWPCTPALIVLDLLQCAIRIYLSTEPLASLVAISQLALWGDRMWPGFDL